MRRKLTWSCESIKYPLTLLFVVIGYRVRLAQRSLGLEVPGWSGVRVVCVDRAGIIKVAVIKAGECKADEA